jgi:hypothetical protein
MISLFWIFIGSIVGLFIVAIFNPPIRKTPKLPNPEISEIFHTKNGCVKVVSEEVSCTPEAVSLNVIIGK